MPLTLKTSLSGEFTLDTPASSGIRTITLPDSNSELLGKTAVSASTTNTVTTKVAVVLGGVTYYLLASTSGT